MKKSFKAISSRGFTLIELLVVIAIIGILAATILISINIARAKSQDVKVISDVHQIRTSLESGLKDALYRDLYSDQPDTAATPGFLTSNGTGYNDINQLMADAAGQGGLISFVITTNSTTGDILTPNAIAYAIYGQLVSTSTEFFCMDSVGGTDQLTTTSNTVTCP